MFRLLNTATILLVMASHLALASDMQSDDAASVRSDDPCAERTPQQRQPNLKHLQRKLKSAIKCHISNPHAMLIDKVDQPSRDALTESNDQDSIGDKLLQANYISAASSSTSREGQSGFLDDSSDKQQSAFIPFFFPYISNYAFKQPVKLDPNLPGTPSLYLLPDGKADKRGAPKFVGKRDPDKETASRTGDYLVQYEPHNDLPSLEADSLALPDNGDRDLFQGGIQYWKRGVPKFVGKRLATILGDSLLSQNKRGAPRFIGKRGAPFFVGKKGLKNHLGGDFMRMYYPEEVFQFADDKRAAPKFVGKRFPFISGKRWPPKFVGKRFRDLGNGHYGYHSLGNRRGPPKFVGRRASPKFVGKRKALIIAGTDVPDLNDSRYSQSGRVSFMTPEYSMTGDHDISKGVTKHDRSSVKVGQFLPSVLNEKENNNKDDNIIQNTLIKDNNA